MKLRSQQMLFPSITFLQLAFFELRVQWVPKRCCPSTTSISTSATTGPSREDLGDAGERHWQVLEGHLPHHLPHLPHDLLVHLPHHLRHWCRRFSFTEATVNSLIFPNWSCWRSEEWGHANAQDMLISPTSSCSSKGEMTKRWEEKAKKGAEKKDGRRCRDENCFHLSTSTSFW